MKSILILVFGLIASQLSQAADNQYALIFGCTGESASMEIWAPNNLVYSPLRLVRELARVGKAPGFYALDLSAAGKGKPLELVQLSTNRAQTVIIVTQVTRPGLPATAIPLAGATVDFDARFGSRAVCVPKSAL